MRAAAGEAGSRHDLGDHAPATGRGAAPLRDDPSDRGTLGGASAAKPTEAGVHRSVPGPALPPLPDPLPLPPFADGVAVVPAPA